MSTLNVENIKHIAADSDSLRLATDGTVTFTKNVTADSATITALSSTNMTASGDITGSSFNGGQLGGRRNLIINGAMQVAQRGASSTGITGNGYYTVDRFATTLNSMGTWTQTQESDAPDGFSKSIKMECTTADASPAAGDYLLIAQKFEGQDLQHLKKGTSSAEPVTASFWVKSNKTGTYIVELIDQDNTARHIGKSFTVNSSGTWEYKTVTFEGDTTGVLDVDNSASIDFSFWLGSGTDFNSGTLQTSWGALSQTNRAVGNVNLADTIGNYFQITGVQLELGETATPFEHRSYGEELALCQRYYQKHATSSAATPMFTGLAMNETTLRIPVTPYGGLMRGTPAITLPGSQLARGNGTSTSITSVAYGNVTSYGYLFNFTTSGLTTHHIYYFVGTVGGGAGLELDAEL